MNRNFRDFSSPPPAERRLRGSARFHRPRDVAAVAGERSEAGRLRGAARRQGAAAGGLRRPMRISGRALLRRRRGRRGATPCCGRSCASTARAAGAWAGSIFTRASVRAATARRSIPAGTFRPTWRARKAWWGDDVTSFLDGSSTSATLTGVNYNAAYDECPRRDLCGHGARIRHAPARRDAAGAARGPVAAQSSRRGRGAARRDQAADTRRVLLRRRRLEVHGLRAGARRRACCAAQLATAT